jgi:hypothetical protein
LKRNPVMRISPRSSTALASIFAALMGLSIISCATPQPAAPIQPSKPNRPPVITDIIGVTEWAPSSDGQLQCVASDPDGDKLTYSWLADNGTLTGVGDTVTWSSPDAMGKYKISCTVSDSKGGETKMVKDVHVFLNADGTITLDPPVVLKISVPSSDTVKGTKRLRIWTAAPVQAVVEGANANDVTYTWTASNGRIQGKGLNEGKASLVTWIAPGVGGQCTLDVVVKDSQGNQARGQVEFTVFCCGNY